MKKRIATLVCLMAALSARAEVVGAMADSTTGEVYPAALENRLVNANGYRIEHSFSDGEIVVVTGIVQAVYSDLETQVADYSAFNTAYPTNRLAWENWGPDGEVTLSILATNDQEGVLSGVDMSLLAQGVAIELASGSHVWVDIVGRELESENPEPNYVKFHPPLVAGSTYWVSAVRGAALDQYGIHYGDATGLFSAWTYLDGSPSSNLPALATHDGVTVYEAHQNGGVRKSVDGGLHWTLLPGSPSGDKPALTTHDGVTVYEAHVNGGVQKSIDGGATWTYLTGSPSGDRPALTTHDGVTVYEAHTSGGVRKSTDGGLTWVTLSGSPSGNNPALATHDGVTVYEAHLNGGVRKSVDGGTNWTDKITDSPSGDVPALATHDGVTVYEAHQSGGVRKSIDGGYTWTQISGGPSGTYPALATHDGVTVYEAHKDGGVRKTSPLFASQATTPYTVIVDATTNDAVSIKDFALSVKGRSDVYCTFETGDDEWSVWATGEWPLMWKTVARKDDGVWYVRTDTNGTYVALSGARDATDAISAAITTNSFNRIPAEGYSPVYGYSAFEGNRPVRIGLTFYPIPAFTNNAANITGVSVLSTRFADGLQWNTSDFDIRLVSTNPAVSEVGWPEPEETRAVIYYAPREREEEE